MFFLVMGKTQIHVSHFWFFTFQIFGIVSFQIGIFKRIFCLADKLTNLKYYL
jgi:hypothetical protein